MDAASDMLNRQLQKSASGESAELPEAGVPGFAAMHAAHMKKEESQIAPMAKWLFSTAQMHRLGNSMRVRRGITAAAGQ